MNTLLLKTFCVILLGFSSLATFGECPFPNYTDVFTACAGGNDLGIVYPAGTSGGEVSYFPIRPNKRTGKGYTHGLACVDETPSPAWYALKIEESGNLLLNISHSKGADIDFLCWGPFHGDSKQAMLENVCANAESNFSDYTVPSTANNCRLAKLAQCEATYAVATTASKIDKIESNRKISDCKKDVDDRSKTDTDYECFYGYSDAFPIAKMTDCGFSKSSSENCFIENAKEGDWYLILVTNFLSVAGNIDFSKVSGDATTDCSVIVDVSSNSPVCEGETLKLWVNNTPAFSTVHWTGPNGFESDEVAPVIPYVTKNGKGAYYAQITTHDGLKSDEVPVVVDIIEKSPVDTIIRMVKGESVTFLGTEFSKAGIYNVSVENGMCSKIYNVTVVEMPLLPAYIEHNGPVCEGESLLLSVADAPTSGVEGYEWRGPDGYYSASENPVVHHMNQSKAGKYSLRIKKDGLSYPVAPVEIVVIPKKVEKVTQHIKLGDTFEFENQTINKRGMYTATFKSDAGCDSVVELYVIVDVPELIPDDYFSPNGDGVNDVFNIKNIEYSPEAVVRIYDRFGKQIYEQTNYSPDNAWNGRDMNGHDLPSTDYWYSIDVPSADRVYFGHFALMR